MTYRLASFLLAILIPAWSAEAGIFVTEFVAASNSGGLPIAVDLKKPGDIRIDIFTPDNDLVASIEQLDLASGKHVLLWDGTDKRGRPVAPEAYTPVATVRYVDAEEERDDPRSYSGGEVLDAIPARLQPDHSVHFDLPNPARVLVRAGIASGPLMKTMINWQPRPAGSNLVRWDGFDRDGVVDLRNEARLRILVTGYRLPDHAIIVGGGSRPDYATFRRELLAEEAVSRRDSTVNEPPLSRDGIRLSPYFFHSRSRDIEPRISASFSGDFDRTTDGVAILRKPVRVVVDMHEDDQAVLDETLYEVAFFSDLRFISEQEQGYVPLTWIFDPSQYGPGRHTLTVNVSAFRGQVGVVTLAFEVPSPSKQFLDN